VGGGLTWSHPVRLAEVARGPVRVRLEPDASTRAQIAKDLGVVSFPTLTADLTVKPWLDGAEISGRFDGVVEQICGISLDAFEQPISGEIEVRVVPPGSTSAPAEPEGGEIELDPEAPDPPEVLDSDVVDLAACLVEHLALTVDPFPRKPGVEFDYSPDPEVESPFAVLKRLKGDEG
jgi:uncharacterized metal-binding protein YceD (DUF177 family)